ncbi:DUF6582 domain-containing protein [Streptomyces sp. NPDC090741]|uniref:DUF6582 domain-containing protein n=1 Tax=Streptomyces sp. NPDC090741 TaxID=3365967 RepID=UPI0038093FF6
MGILGTISGIAIVPGVSRNGRLYTAESIGGAVARAQDRIKAGEQPLTMLSHHNAGDDSTQIVGRLTAIEQDETGAARYTAVLADTAPGRTIAALVDDSDGPPFLRGVSIRGAWVGRVRRELGPNGATVEVGDALDLDGLDFTRKPGVPGARVDTYTPAGPSPAESAPDGRVFITESVQEALVHTVTEAAVEADASGALTPNEYRAQIGLQPMEADTSGEQGPFADPGYQTDKAKRYPLDTKARAKTAWARVHESEVARGYTAAQLKRIRQRVAKALRGHGVEVATQEGWLIDPIGRVSEEVAECLGFSDDPGHGGSMSISLTNGPTTVTVTSWCVDPHDLERVGRAAMAGACTAIAGIDPDMDADIDAPASGMADESATETAPETPAPETPAADTTTLEEETAMAESNTPAAETAAVPATGGVHLTDEQFNQLLARVAPQPAPVAVESAAAEPVTEATPSVTEVAETEEQRIDRLVAAGIAKALPQAVQEHVETTGGPSRKGFVAPVAESAGATGGNGLPDDWPAKPFHEYTDEEWKATAGAAVVGAILGNRAPAAS